MKRVLKLKPQLFSVSDDDGSIILSHNNNLQVVDIEGVVQRNYDLNKKIQFIDSDTNPFIGIDGSLMILSESGHITQYLFPANMVDIPPSCACNNKDNSLVACGVGNLALVFDLEKPLEKALIAILEGHEKPIVFCSFLKHEGYENLLVTVSEDNRFLVWDIKKRVMIYESPFESNSPIRGLCTFETTHLFALAFEDGYVRLYDASPVLNSKPSIKFVKTIGLTKIELNGFEEEEEPPLVISKDKAPKPIIPNSEPVYESLPLIIRASSTVAQGKEFMFVATNSSIISFNINTFEKSVCYTFDEQISYASFFSQIVAGLCSFSGDIHVKRITVGFIPELGAELFPEEDPPEESPLLSSIQPKTKDTTPIATLHKNIKSSGYTKKPPCPPKRLQKKTPQDKKSKEKKVEKNEITSFKVPKSVTSTIQVHETPISTAALSPDGKRLITTDGSGTIVFVKPKTSILPAYLGHTIQVTQINWNTKQNFVSSSTDKTVKIWDIDRPDPLLTINTLKTPDKGDPFPEEVSGCSFLWEDKFIVTSCGKNISLYGYKLPNLSSKNVQDMHQTGTYKRIFNTGITSGKIVSFAASNMPKSPLVIAATSTKQVIGFDFYSCQSVLTLESQHERPIFSVIADYGGIYTPRTTDGLILTGAYDETFKLFDIRSAQSVRTFVAGSKTKRVGSCFSPDSKYVALGTERLGIEIWDIGEGKCVSKLKDEFRGTAVTWMAWNPSSGRLQCATEKGEVKILQ